jgi:sugar lactone lactonase YvrE
MTKGRAVSIAFLCLGAAFGASAQAQQYVIANYAGGPPPPGTSQATPSGSIATDTLGNVYFASYSTGNNPCVCVFKLDPNGVLTRVAGSAQHGFSGDGGPATSAQLSGPMGMAVDGAGNLFIADEGGFYFGSFPNGSSSDRIRKVSPDGIITTVAGGGGLAGSAADGGRATSAELFQAYYVAADNAGNLFVSETVDDDGGGSNRIRKVSPDGIITTVAGNGTFGFAGDGGPAIKAQLNGPGSLAVDSAGNLLFVDSGNARIRQVSPDGIITTVVDVSASFSLYCYCSLMTLALDAAGNLFFNLPDGSVSERSAAGVITTALEAGTGLSSFWLAVDGSDNLFLTPNSPFFQRGLIKVSRDGSITPLAGNGACCYSGDGGPAIGAGLQLVNSVADGAINLFIGGVNGAGNLYFADSGNRRIRMVDPSGIITTVAGNGAGAWNVHCDGMTGDSGPALAAQLCAPSQVAVDGAGDLFIVDRNRIRKVTPDGTISSLAGDGTIGPGGGDGMPATQPLTYPNSVAVDAAGNVFFTEWARVRKISPDGTIITVAGTGSRPNTGGCSPPTSPACGPPPVGDGQPATSVQLFGPTSVAVDGAGNLYFVDGVRIRKVTGDGTITTVAGNGGRAGYMLPTGDGGLATDAPLWGPSGVTVDSAGNLYISEQVRVREVTTDGIIHTIAGTADPGYSGDGGPATKAQFHVPTGLTVDGAGNVYVADSLNNAVRVLRPIQ